MKKALTALSLFFSIALVAQQQVTLNDCYHLVEVHYPLAKQQQLLEQQNSLQYEALSNGKLPQLDVEAQASYQSDVTEVPLPNAPIKPLNKDQYRATLTLNQPIYNGGIIEASLAAKATELKAKQQEVRVSLYQLKLQINHLYFSILLNQKAQSLLEAKQAQLQSKLEEVKAGVKYGALLPASDHVLEAELLKLKQQFIQLESDKESLMETLSKLIDQPLDATTTFETPLVETDLNGSLSRPELDLYHYKKEEVENSEAILAKQNLPKLNAFATGGYGNPGLNMLDNSFQTFYMVGLKLKWHAFDWNSNKKEREALALNKNIIDNEAETFRLNTNIALVKQQKDIEKNEALVTSDAAIVSLRKQVLVAADSQLKNGVITASEYLIEFTNLLEAENALMTHKIQLELAKANYNILQGKNS